MPVVVEAPDHQMMFLDERLLGRQYRIVLLRQCGGFVQMPVERWFVRDDQVVSGGRTPQSVVGCHHGGGDAGDRRVGNYARGWRVLGDAGSRELAAIFGSLADRLRTAEAACSRERVESSR